MDGATNKKSNVQQDSKQLNKFTYLERIMTRTIALKLASSLVLSLAALGAAQAGTVPADKYDYEFRTGESAGTRVPADKYGYEFRTHDTFTDGARAGKFDAFTDGARKVAGLDKAGVSAEPARSFDPYLDGARA
jgi:hypothetical protein